MAEFHFQSYHGSDQRRMESLLRPTDDTQVREAVAWAASENKPMAVLGAGSKTALGRPANLDTTMDLCKLTGVLDYEPSELVLTARPGTSLAEIDACLREQNQELAFEPPDLAPLLGTAPNIATLGGTIACNLSGPRRVRVGAARDHFLGMRAINGRAEAFKAGGKVVKNVTGYDLCKLIAGSYGTLALLTEVTVKVLPRAEKTRTVLLFGLEENSAISTLSDVMASVHEPTALAHLPANIAARSSVDLVSNAGCAATAVRVEGPTPSTIFRCEKLRGDFSKLGEVEELHGQRSATFWKEVANVTPFVTRRELTVWRIAVAPIEAAIVTASIGSKCNAEWYYDWAGGLIWLATPQSDVTSNNLVRDSVASAGGQATLIRAEANVRTVTSVFEPLPAALYKLSARVKQSFDPKGIFNPGRLSAGM